MSASSSLGYKSYLFARIISFATSPTLLAAPAFIVLLLVIHPPALVLELFVAVVFGTFLPLLIIYALYRTGKIDDLEVSDRKKRWMPFIGAIAAYAAGTSILFVLAAPAIITALMFAYIGNTLVSCLISFRWKISVHAVGLTGPITGLVYYLGWLYGLWLLFILPVGWARIKLKAHTWMQLIAGFFLGIFLTWTQLLLILPFLSG